MRYIAPSLSETSHSSRYHRAAWYDACGAGTEVSPPPAAAHHSPDVLHGPEARTTLPPVKPRRSVVTRTGRPSATATRAGTGWRQRRIALTTVDAEPAEPAEFSPNVSLRGSRAL